MARQDKLRCEVYEVVFPEWARVTKERQEAIWQVLNSWNDFIGKTPSRKGFAPGIKRLDNLIAGFYIQEDLREGLEGDSLLSLKHSQNANFEKLFFALIFDLGYVIIQRTNLTGYVTMNYTQMRNDFELVLAEVFNRAEITVNRIQLAKFYRKRTAEEMRAIFFGNTCHEAEITGLYKRTVPDSTQLSNPDPSEEGMLKRIFNREFETVDGETLRAAPGKDLRSSKSGKAAVSAGDTRKLVIQMPNGNEETLYVEQDEKLDIPVDDSKEAVSPSEMSGVIEIIDRRIRMPANLFATGRPLPNFGPLFEAIDGKHD